MIGQLGLERLVIHAVVHVHQHGELGLQTLDPSQRLIEIGMRRVRPPAERIQNPDVHAFV